MGKNDFDTDFDFEEEFGFDPKAFLGTEEFDDDIDLSEFTDEELGLSSPKEPQEKAPEEEPVDYASDLDLSGLDLGSDFDLDEDLDLDDILGIEKEEEPEEEEEEAEPEDEDDPDLSFESEAADEPELPDDFDFSEDDALIDDLNFSDEEDFGSDQDFPEDLEPEETDMHEHMDYSEDTQQTVFQDGPVYDEQAEEERGHSKFKMPEIRRKERKERKEAKPTIFNKFFDLYFAPLMNKNAIEEPVDPKNPRRRRRKSKVQIFKEVYLPPIIVCVCAILVLSFLIGSVSNAIDRHVANNVMKDQQEQAASQAADQLEQEYQNIMDQAAELAAGYDYEGAIGVIDSFSDAANISKYPDMVAKRAEYANAQTQMVEYKDPSLIPNLSFHVLIADPSRAFNDTDYGGKYNQNFVTIDEFSKILQQLYDNGFVLVDFDSFTEANAGVNGNEVFSPKTIYLPEGKKPVMITETMVNYLEYMVDSNGDGEADAGGDGFASRLVVDDNGDIKAEYVNVNSETLIGNYDLVPILEDFIAAHPDFSYQGARATLAVCGYNGIFGYRINNSYVATKGSAYQEEQIAGAKKLVQALRDKGYTLASYTYDNVAYGKLSAAQITADLQSWTSQITPVIGEVDVLVFAQNSKLSDYTGNSFNVLYQTGFRYFVSNGTDPYAEVNNTYVRQNRLLVTGENMQWYPSQFTDEGLFDPNLVLDMTSRVSVPKSAS